MQLQLLRNGEPVMVGIAAGAYRFQPPAPCPLNDVSPVEDGWSWTSEEGETWAFIPYEPPPPPFDMPALRRMAYANMAAYADAVTARDLREYSEAERASWPQQEAEARTVLAGGSLSPEALVPELADDAGKPIREFAASVVAKAGRFRMRARFAVQLRRGLDGLLSPALDTPARLDDAVVQLKAQVDAAAAQLDG